MVSCAGATVAVTPSGKPLTEIVTGSENPPMRAIVTEIVPVPPCDSVVAVGDAEMAIEPAGPAPWSPLHAAAATSASAIKPRVDAINGFRRCAGPS